MIKECDKCGRMSASGRRCSVCGEELPLPSQQVLSDQEIKKKKRKRFFQFIFDVGLLLSYATAIPMFICAGIFNDVADASTVAGNIMLWIMGGWLVMCVVSAIGHWVCGPMEPISNNCRAEAVENGGRVDGEVDPMGYEMRIRIFIEENEIKNK